MQNQQQQNQQQPKSPLNQEVDLYKRYGERTVGRYPVFARHPHTNRLVMRRDAKGGLKTAPLVDKGGNITNPLMYKVMRSVTDAHRAAATPGLSVNQTAGGGENLGKFLNSPNPRQRRDAQALVNAMINPQLSHSASAHVSPGTTLRKNTRHMTSPEQGMIHEDIGAEDLQDIWRGISNIPLSEQRKMGNKLPWGRLAVEKAPSALHTMDAGLDVANLAMHATPLAQTHPAAAAILNLGSMATGPAGSTAEAIRRGVDLGERGDPSQAVGIPDEEDPFHWTRRTSDTLPRKLENWIIGKEGDRASALRHFSAGLVGTAWSGVGAPINMLVDMGNNTWINYKHNEKALAAVGVTGLMGFIGSLFRTGTNMAAGVGMGGFWPGYMIYSAARAPLRHTIEHSADTRNILGKAARQSEEMGERGRLLDMFHRGEAKSVGAMLYPEEGKQQSPFQRELANFVKDNDIPRDTHRADVLAAYINARSTKPKTGWQLFREGARETARELEPRPWDQLLENTTNPHYLKKGK